MAEEFLLIVVLILVNGFFAAVEMALVTSRPHRLRSLLDEGKKSAQDVLQVKEKPGPYLATVQVGITLVGSLASAFGGLAAAPTVAKWLGGIPYIGAFADELALLLIVLTITYLSLVFGELVPKQLALRNPEGLSIALVRPVKLLGQFAALPIRFLSFSTDLVLGLIGRPSDGGPSTSAEEIELLVKQGTTEGIFQISEGAFVRGVFDYGDRKAYEVMTPRPEIVAFDSTMDPRVALNQAAKSGFSRFPVYEETLDNALGYVHLKDLVWANKDTTLKTIVRQLVFIPESTALPVIYNTLTKQRVHMAIVLDEHGGTAGLLTLEDVLEVIVGEIDDEYHLTHLNVHKLGERSWLVSGDLLVTELNEAVGSNIKPSEVYSTTAGLVLAELGHIPKVGESLQLNGYKFVVRAMDNLRIDRILVQRNK